MYEAIQRRACRALVLLPLLLGSCGGGGGGAAAILFFLLTVNPNVSNDLNGGENVVITGQGFENAVVLNVTFGGRPVVAFTVEDDSTIRAQTPPAPGGSAGPVTIEVTSQNAGVESLSSAYTYQVPSNPPNPESITPTTFTATGAEDFTIEGTTLGTPGGTVQVAFGGLGTVTGTVNGDGTMVTGRAPVTPGPPPGNAITVNVQNASGNEDVPTQVQYAHGPAQSIVMPGQLAGGASRPVRVADGVAVICNSGLDRAWNTADDDVFVLTFTPGGGGPTQVTVLRGGAASVGFLDQQASIPLVMDANTVCIYSRGFDGLVNTVDDRITVISALQTTPSVTDHHVGFLIRCPLGRVDATRVAYLSSGPNQTAGDPDDALNILDLNNPGSPTSLSFFGPADLAPGATNISIPQSPDGDAVFVMSPGPNGIVNDVDDTFRRYTISTGNSTTAFGMPFVLGRARALSATVVVAPGAGPNTIFGDADDVLYVAQDGGGGFAPVGPHSLAGPLSAGAIVPLARIGAGGVALPIRGATPANDLVQVFTDPVAGTTATLALPGVPLLATLGSGNLVAFAAGVDGLPGSGDEQVVLIDAAATTSQPFAPGPTWPHNPLSPGGQDRAFGVSPGGDGAPGTGDETLLVFQSRAVGTIVNVTSLPMATPQSPVPAATPFIPIGSGWGLIQSPGFNGLFGDGNDLLILVQY